MLLGHAHPEVRGGRRRARSPAARRSARPPRPEVELAEEIVARTPVEQVRLVSSGTEATMSAIRLARGFTGRDLVVKFAGCYHGHVDSLLASAGSGLATFAVPGTPGVPAAVDRTTTVVLPYNDRAAVEAAFADARRPDRLRDHRGGAGQHGRGPARARASTGSSPRSAAAHGALFVSDEVMTGFRVSPRRAMRASTARSRAGAPT